MGETAMPSPMAMPNPMPADGPARMLTRAEGTKSATRSFKVVGKVPGCGRLKSAMAWFLPFQSVGSEARPEYSVTGTTQRSYATEPRSKTIHRGPQIHAPAKRFLSVTSQWRHLETAATRLQGHPIAPSAWPSFRLAVRWHWRGLRRRASDPAGQATSWRRCQGPVQ